ncbi:uncharacterized protein LOC100259014 isoform X2 [Vitis vinifera]|uniref:uncharacterized protein LOC100259014 isoform X2 n=1 Tax=Vitis vinifera TaxID=29760 RepID=UPI0008FFA3FE|nr:uncharacterized protein LOC100259014 isoform X2 [Vitis vinifera]|eukprot:XP_019076837.1 PREDICTED: uncharacterized protein LOC100259014 isoform X3 [Vitis vinifera]
MESEAVREFIRREVKDWEEEAIATARFKAFSGQRSDWEARYQFWRDLILKVARHFHLLFISSSQVKKDWFNRGGLTPLCLDHVLDKTVEVVKVLSESQWTSSCVITMKKFQDICGGTREASAVLSYLSGCGKAQYLSISKKELIEGVKVSLSAAAVSGTTSLDLDVLHLTWTTENLQQQLDVIDQRCEVSKKAALASLNSGNKKVALRHAKALKLASESREKCISFLNRVEEVLSLIANAESTKKVSEAIQIGARAIQENRIDVEEVQRCLQELGDSIDSQKQVEEALAESDPSYVDIEDEDIEEEFRKLELELGNQNLQILVSQAGVDTAAGETEASESSKSLCDALSDLKLADNATRGSTILNSTGSKRDNISKNLKLEAA